MADFMPTPWDRPDSASWFVHADWLAEYQPKEVPGRLQALRIAEGLRKRPVLVLTQRVRENRISRIYCVLPGATLTELPGRFVWVTCTWASRQLTDPELSLEETAKVYGATPLSFPGLTQDLTWRNHVLRLFYFRASYDVKLLLRGNDIWIRRGQHEFLYKGPGS